MENTLLGTEEWSNYPKRGQVYWATHDGEGNPLTIERSFISFSWGGRDIEEFSFIAVLDGDRYNGNMYSEFNDLTSDYDVVDGQKYWGTTYQPNTLTFTLGTDGVKESVLQDFRNWFRPGREEELILAEYPYRAIKARVSVVPSYSLLPFEAIEEIQINGTSYSTSTTEWKGTVTLTFVMDDPFWYNTESYFFGNNLTKEQVKSIIEDGIPHEEMININNEFNNIKAGCYLANDYYWCNNENNNNNETDENASTNKKTIGNSEVINLSKGYGTYLYYCGTAKSKPIIKFSLTFTYDTNGEYIDFPANSYANKINTSEQSNEQESSGTTLEIEDEIVKQNGVPLNYLQIGKNKFVFTTPGILTSYNQVVKILKQDFKVGDSILELREAIRDSITDYYIRSFATGLCELSEKYPNKISICDTAGALVDGYDENFIEALQLIFPNKKCDYSFNSQNGESKMTIGISMLQLQEAENFFNQENNKQMLPLHELVPVDENVGDMVRSNYMIIEERNMPSSNPETGALEITKDNCLLVTANCDLNDVKISYKYMYL